MLSAEDPPPLLLTQDLIKTFLSGCGSGVELNGLVNRGSAGQKAHPRKPAGGGGGGDVAEGGGEVEGFCPETTPERRVIQTGEFPQKKTPIWSVRDRQVVP